MDDETNESLRIWDGVAEGWEKYRDFINAAESLITERLLDGLDARDGDAVLELTAGPGSVGLLLAERRPNVRVLITDFAPHMVEAAERGAKERGLTNVECRQMDAQAIDLPESSVDGVFSRYGLMIPPDRAKTFSEIRRVLKPGRSLAYAVWGPIEANAWMMLMGAVLMQRGHFTPDPGGMPLATEDANREVLGTAGFTEVQTEVLDAPMTYESFGQYWEVNGSVGGPVAEIIRNLPADERNAVRSAVEEFSAPFLSDAGLALPASRVFVRAK